MHNVLSEATALPVNLHLKIGNNPSLPSLCKKSSCCYTIEDVGIDSEDSFDITKYILDEKKEEIPFAEFGRNGKHYLRADTDEEAELYIPIIMEAIGTDFTYSIEGVTDGEVDAAEVPFGDFDFSELNYDEEEFDKMFEKLNRESQD